MSRMSVVFAGLLLVAGMLPAIAQKDDKPRFLYVQNAGSMTLRDGTLTLTNVSPLTLFFSDRPERVAGHMRTAAFIRHWDKGANSFKESPPNATVAVFQDATKIIDAVLEISEPQFDGTKLSYKAKVLLGAESFQRPALKPMIAASAGSFHGAFPTPALGVRRYPRYRAAGRRRQRSS